MSGDQISDLILEHPLIPQKDIPVVIYNAITSSYGTGINVVSPGHEVESLKIATVSLLHNCFSNIIYQEMDVLMKEVKLQKNLAQSIMD